MYPKEIRESAVTLLRQGYSSRQVARFLGGPSSWTVERWRQELLTTGSLKNERVGSQKFTDEQKKSAVDHYLGNGKNLSRTVAALGFPSRALLAQWIDQLAPGERKKTRPHKETGSMSLERKAEALVTCYLPESGGVKHAAREMGIDPVTIYNWRKELLGGRARAAVREASEGYVGGDAEQLRGEVEALKAEIRRLRLEKAVWEGAADLVKKDPGVDPANLTNREKALLIDALRPEFPVDELLAAVGIPKSSYYYQREALGRADKYADLRIRIAEIFSASRGTFGSLRIWAELRRGDELHEPVIVSEKVVRRLMAEGGLVVSYSKKKKSWSSYAGEISKAPENLVNRNFHADEPNKIWLTDITEFSLPFGKAYLSPIIDCFDGMVVAWGVSERPDGKLATDMLEAAIAKLPAGRRVVCHSDRGVHYRTKRWIELCEVNGIDRSMSKKGCSPDNSACEGFFGRLKNEFFYYRDWTGVNYETFVAMLAEYMHYYNVARIKQSLGWLSPAAYRQSLGLAA